METEFQGKGRRRGAFKEYVKRLEVAQPKTGTYRIDRYTCPGENFRLFNLTTSLLSIPDLVPLDKTRFVQTSP